MKIVHIITAFGVGGAEKLLLNVINKQVERHKVFLIYFKSKNELVSELNERVEVFQVPFSLFMIKKIKQLFEVVNPDIIHTHLGHADFIGAWAARKTRAKIFCTMHNISFKKNFSDIIFFQIYTLLFLKIVKKGEIISISKAVEDHVLKRLKIPTQRSHLLYNAIPKKKLNLKKGFDTKCNLLFIGRLEKQKSINTLLDAISILRTKGINQQLQLKIVGSGKLSADLESQAKMLKINDIVDFMGEQKVVDCYYEESDIFILPSIWEGFGIVILEAFRSKTAVIATNIEGPAELITNEVNGLLFEPKNSVELAKKIQDLIENKNKRKRLAENGHRSFTKSFHINSYVEKLNKLYGNN